LVELQADFWQISGEQTTNKFGGISHHIMAIFCNLITVLWRIMVILSFSGRKKAAGAAFSGEITTILCGSYAN
jgi:hypothetical protein